MQKSTVGDFSRKCVQQRPLNKKLGISSRKQVFDALPCTKSSQNSHRLFQNTCSRKGRFLADLGLGGTPPENGEPMMVSGGEDPSQIRSQNAFPAQPPARRTQVFARDKKEESGCFPPPSLQRGEPGFAGNKRGSQNAFSPAQGFFRARRQWGSRES